MIKYCVENKSFIGSSLNNKDTMEDVLERCAYFGLRKYFFLLYQPCISAHFALNFEFFLGPQSVDATAAEAYCISKKTDQEEPPWRAEH